MIKYSLDSWDNNRFLSGHRYNPDTGLWQYFDPLIIAAMIAGRFALEGAEHTTVELRDNSIELCVWWTEEHYANA
jgi:hypothetical protein